MAGRKISKKSLEIIELINEGKRPCAVIALGYPEETVRYYWRKIKFPRKYKAFVRTITTHNRNRVKFYK
jgi:hypothetical protein